MDNHAAPLDVSNSQRSAITGRPPDGWRQHLNANKGGNIFVDKFAKVFGVVLLCAGLLISVGPVNASATAGPQETQNKDKDKDKEKTKANPEQPKAPEQGATVTVSGKVATINAAKLTIVDDQKAEVTLEITPDTKITKSGKAITAADIKADDLVTVLAKKGEDDSLSAVRIVVT